ncbi:hypothetical protein PV04_08357 [Phialophora macrospora]|uniref:Uncharacterized protein n=1 Tax=Phialophora macrospora TaxID=1851006 RepID=A0A0D2CLP4_9EURO|nr:hypothetical protein PV04_08357 [Phialophora macrospora]
MPTFFPGVQKAVSCSKAVEVSAQSFKMASKYPAPKGNRNTKGPGKAPSVRQYRQDDDLASQPDTVYSQQSYKYAPGIPNLPNVSQWRDNGGQHGPSQYERRPGQRGDQQFQVPERFASSPTLPDVDMYEHILLLRKHGMSVKLTHETARIMSQLDPTEADDDNNNNGFLSHSSSSTDRYNPSRKETRSINRAMTFVMRRGGEIDIPALEPQSVCDACSEPFDTTSEKPYHCDRARNR